MDLARHLDAIATAGQQMVAALAVAGPDAAVPTCPGWVVRDAVRHQGEVHRWATAIVRDALVRPDVDSEALAKPWPDDASLGRWLLDGCDALVATLRDAPADLECFAFLPAPSPRAFWARRQAHETGVHRADVEAAAGSISPFDDDIAVDGIGELLHGFASRSRSKLRSTAPRSLLLDAGVARWHVTILADRLHVADRDDDRDGDREDGDAACRVRAKPSDLFLFLWNRLPRDAVEVEGDSSVLDLWQSTMQIRWS